MSIQTRIDRLERAAAAIGCPTCEERGFRVVQVRPGDPEPPRDGSKCPECGRNRPTIIVRYVAKPGAA